MIAGDTNILVYGHCEDSVWHVGASAEVTKLAEGRSPWTIPWACVHELIAVVTRPRIYSTPTPLAGAIAPVEAWFESPSLILIAEREEY
jgi:predicted nucleic acid-binding protein